MASTLLSVPLEVLLQITYHLTTPEYCTIRLVCKQLERTLLTAFTREYFTKRQFMLTEFSLQALVDISKSRFSPCINHVIFGLERPAITRYHSTGPPQPSMPCFNRELEEYISFMTLINTGQDVEMVSEAFANLANLETVGMRDFNSRSRRRDFPDNDWKSYGAPTYERETLQSLQRVRRVGGNFNFNSHDTASLDQAQYLSRVFLNILRALGKSGARPKNFEVILRQSSLHDHAFNLPKYVAPIVQPVLADLRTLFLDLNSVLPPFYTDVPIPGSTTNSTLPCPSRLLTGFLSKLRCLEHLRLNFAAYSWHDANGVLDWLSKPLPATSGSTMFDGANNGSNLQTGTPLPISLPNLRQLDIGMITIFSETLLSIVEKFLPTLRIISFHKVTLSQKATLHPLSDDQNPRPNLWARFFEKISNFDPPLKLEAMNMSLLYQDVQLPIGGGGAFVGTTALVTFNHRDVRKWAGTNCSSGLRDFVAEATVQWPPEPMPMLGSASETSSEYSDESMHDDSDADDDNAQDES